LTTIHRPHWDWLEQKWKKKKIKKKCVRIQSSLRDLDEYILGDLEEYSVMYGKLPTLPRIASVETTSAGK
jgi:hypothetical protein